MPTAQTILKYGRLKT